MLDLRITGGTIVDGTGAPGYRGDVGISDGRIVALGEVVQDAREEIDATGRIVSPGFVDLHTHYDVQVFWDPALSPSCFHGVTTVVAGLCGFSVAPATPEAAEYLGPMLARVEGMPLETLDATLPWSWRSFGEYLDAIDGKVGLNAGFLVGHSAIRRVVMGERAVGETATPAELEAMKALLGQSLAGGALGFSSTIAVTHNDGDGNPVPSRWASREEIIELARVVGGHEGTTIEFLPSMDFEPGIAELLADISLAGQRAVNWNVLAIMNRPEAIAKAERQLAATDLARARGGEVLALTVPTNASVFLNLRTGVGFDSLPGIWREIFRWSVEERIERFADPELRRRMASDAASLPRDSVLVFAADYQKFRIVSVDAEASRKYEGRIVEDVARAERREPIDVLLDIAVADGLETIFATPLGDNDPETYRLRGKVWQDDRALIGASDAGAHIDMIDTFAFSTTMLSEGVRNHKVIGLEQAVRLLTGRPARYMGLVDRGLLRLGHHADIVVFDADAVGCGPIYNRHDVPGGHMRIYAEAEGIDHVIVNGVEVVRKGVHTGRLPGTVLRSGRDTMTVPLDAMREPPG